MNDVTTFLVKNEGSFELFRLDSSPEACEKAGFLANEKVIDTNNGKIYVFLGVDDLGKAYFSEEENNPERHIFEMSDLPKCFEKLSEFEARQKRLAKDHKTIFFTTYGYSLVININEEDCKQVGFTPGETFLTFDNKTVPQQIKLTGITTNLYAWGHLNGKKPINIRVEEINSVEINSYNQLTKLFTPEEFKKTFTVIHDESSETWVNISDTACEKFGVKAGDTVTAQNGMKEYTFVGTDLQGDKGCLLDKETNSLRFLKLEAFEKGIITETKRQELEEINKKLRKENKRKIKSFIGDCYEIVDTSDEACLMYGCQAGDVILGTWRNGLFGEATVLGVNQYGLWIQPIDNFQSNFLCTSDFENENYGNKVITKADWDTQYCYYELPLPNVLNKKMLILDVSAKTCQQFGFQAGDSIILPETKFKAKVLGVSLIPFGKTHLSVMIILPKTTRKTKEEPTHYGPKNLRELGFILESEMPTAEKND